MKYTYPEINTFTPRPVAPLWKFQRGWRGWIARKLHQWGWYNAVVELPTRKLIEFVVTDQLRRTLIMHVDTSRALHQDIDRIVMGWNQVNEFAELVSDGRLMPIVDVAELRVRGYPVQLVPHFDGILVIPKLKEPT